MLTALFPQFIKTGWRTDHEDREHPGMWDRSRDGLYVRVCKPWMLSTTCKYVRLWRPREWQHIDREHALEVIKKLGWE